MRRHHWVIGGLVALGVLRGALGWAVPSNSISIPNSFTSGTTANASDVNANFSEVSTKFNAHSHTDLTGTTSNTLTFGDGTSTGNKRFIADIAGGSDPEIRYNVSTSLWQLTNDGTTFNSLRTPGIVQIFKTGGGGAAATTSSTYVDIPGEAITLTTTTGNETKIEFEASGSTGGTGDTVRVQLVVDGTAEAGTERYAQQPASANFFISTSTNRQLSGASHTLKPQWRSHLGNTVNLNAAGYVTRVTEYSK